MLISPTPCAAAVSMIVCSAGIVLSPPSRPKRLVVAYFLAQNASKPSASIRSYRISRLALGSKALSQGAPSIRRWIQDFWSGSWICMNSTPIEPQ